MSDWQAGDLALCVNAGECPTCEPGCPLPALVGNVVYIISAIEEAGDGGLIFDLVGIPKREDWGFCEEHFRKIRPDEQEACEPEFVTLLKRSKQRIAA